MKGFSLIELVIAMTIVFIMMALVFRLGVHVKDTLVERMEDRTELVEDILDEPAAICNERGNRGRDSRGRCR